jgi:hypothetical protein
MLKYSLSENFLTPSPNDFMAVPVDVRVYDLKAIKQRIEARYPGLTPAQISAAIDEFFLEVSNITEEGDGVNTPLFNTFPSVPGVFESAADTFDSKRHKCKVNISAGTLLNAAGQKIKTEKVVVPDPLPYIMEVRDIVSDTFGEMLTPGGVIQLRGSRLKFLTEQDDNGIFLINEIGVATKLAVIVENKPARLMAMLPAGLPQGIYTVEVRTSYTGSVRPRKSVRSGSFYRQLTVS